MGIEPPYIGLYGVWSMVGIEVRGMGWFGLRLGVIGVWYGLVNGGSGYFESGLQHSPAPESCATPPPKNRVR